MRMLALALGSVALILACVVIWLSFPRHSQHAEAIEQIYEKAQLAGIETSREDPAKDKAVLELLPRLCAGKGAERSLIEELDSADLEWLAYRELLMSAEHALIGCARAEVTEEQAHEFYDEHLGNFDRQDVLSLDLDVWRDGAVTESTQWVVTEENIRTLHEQHDEVLSQSLALMPGEETLVTRSDGSSVMVRCTDRVEMGQYPFEEVQAAAAQQLAQQRVDELIAEQVSAHE